MAVASDPSSNRCRFGLYEFDPRTGELTREGRTVKLAPQPARVLARLLEHPGELVLRDELRDLLWGQDTFVDFERGLNFCILQVRTALGDNSDNPRFVQTVPRKGYRFIAPVAIAPNGTLAPAPRTAPVAPAPSAPAPALPHPLHLRSPALTPRHLWAAAVLASVAAVLWFFATRPSAGDPQPEANRIRLVVLPVTNLTGDNSSNLLADGLTDAVIAELGQLSPRRLAVIARTSAMTYRDRPRPVAEIGRDLNVAYLVETSLSRENGALRINSQVIAAADQTPLASLSETFGGSGNGPSSESHMAIRVSRFVAAALLPSDADGSATRPTSDATAWEAYVRGRALLHRGTADETTRAMGEFEAATTADPSFAAAWAGLVEAHHLRVMIGMTPPLDAYPAARVAATRAREADAAASETHLADGLVTLWFDRDPARAAAAFERALARNASSAAAHHDYAWALLALGRDEAAIAAITAARDLDPLSARANTDIGWLYLQLNRPADAERACQRTLAVHPNALEPQACLERAYAMRGLWRPALEAARTTAPDDAYAQATANGRDAESALRALWRWRLGRLEEAAGRRWISPYTLAVQHALVGQRDQALSALSRARDERAGMLLFVKRDPALDALRGDPRFNALLDQAPAQ
jgi:DNA-binding winged helix-turn-helix (wHTH) protein/TolB-like protein/tetratricopeptide (TPR) repeat protein